MKLLKFELEVDIVLLNFHLAAKDRVAVGDVQIISILTGEHATCKRLRFDRLG
jgi:hypothetical protein